MFSICSDDCFFIYFVGFFKSFDVYVFEEVFVGVVGILGCGDVCWVLDDGGRERCRFVDFIICGYLEDDGVVIVGFIYCCDVVFVIVEKVDVFLDLV